MNLESFKRKFSVDIGSNLLIEIIKGAGVIVAASSVSFIGADSIGKTQNFLNEYVLPLFALFFIISTLTINWAYNAFRRHRPTFPRLEPDFHLIEKHIYHEYRSATEIQHRRRYKLKALRNGLDAYRDRYQWTGQGSISISSAIPGQCVQTAFQRNVWTFFDIRFSRNLQKNETVTAEVVWDFVDPQQKALRSFSATIHEPTDVLHLELKLPLTYTSKEAVCEHYGDFGAKTSFGSEVKQIDKNGLAKWIIPKPGLLHYYEVRWVE
ncbi:MAG: hypothetical protein M0P64_02990 [Candidatus Pacebacteria bacterium]|jgi:hypothetical protein|nr:hypothetical protein [Candidatus Paceibacterota bacterium]